MFVCMYVVELPNGSPGSLDGRHDACMYVYVYVLRMHCICVRLCVYVYTHTHTYIYIYISEPSLILLFVKVAFFADCRFPFTCPSPVRISSSSSSSDGGGSRRSPSNSSNNGSSSSRCPCCSARGLEKPGRLSRRLSAAISPKLTKLSH